MSIQLVMPSNHLHKTGFPSPPPEAKVIIFSPSTESHATVALFYFEIQTHTVNKKSTWEKGRWGK